MRRDELGITTVEVEDLRIALRLSWGEFRALVSGSQNVTPETADAALDEMTEALRKHVIGVEGLTEPDAEGNEIAVAWQPEMVNELAPHLVQAIFRKLVNPGAERQAGDPLV